MQFVGIEIQHNVHETAKGDPAIPNLWDTFNSRLPEIEDQSDTVLGVSGPVREGFSHYVAALQIEKVGPIPSGMILGTVPAGKYAEFIHRGPISSFAATVSYIHNTWMPQAGFSHHACSQIEVMSKNSDVDAANFEMKVLVPL